MKIAIVSDLHLETQKMTSLACKLDDFDILVAAGDIAASSSNICPIDNLSRLSMGKEVLFVLGNHEYETYHIKDAIKRLKDKSLNSFVSILDNESVIKGDVKFIGSTLWSSLHLPNTDFEDNIKDVLVMSDFHHKRADGSVLSIDEVIDNNFYCVEFLKNELLSNTHDLLSKSVVITHFPPSIKSIAAKYKGNAQNAWFANDLDERLIEMSSLWIHGHTHTSFDYKVGRDPNRGMVVCNPMGFSNTIRLSNFNPSMHKYILSLKGIWTCPTPRCRRVLSWCIGR